ncbi:MAG: PEP/pyruvate-binding domain-containing protein [Pirellulaceae bacterium]|nr:hypothetical protein [Planctomycetales bacterium]
MERQVLSHRYGDPLKGLDVNDLGSKGYVLSRLAAARYRVPDGFVLTTAACRMCLSDSTAIASRVRAEIDREVARLESCWGRKLGSASSPLLLAVRSGAPVSMPGLLRTVLGVGVPHTNLDPRWAAAPFANAQQLLKETLPEYFEQLNRQNSVSPQMQPTDDPIYEARQQLTCAFQAVLQSWLAPSVVAYRQIRKIDEHVGMAVNIQVYEDVTTVGVLYTRHPHDDSGERMLVEVAPAHVGVVSGSATPQSYDLWRSDHTFSEEKRNGATSQPTLQQSYGPQLHRKLIDLASALEKESLWSERGTEQQVRNSGLDIEWGWNGFELIVFQVREVQIAEGADAQPGPSATMREVEAECCPGILLVKHSIAESLVHPTPLTWCLVRKMFAGDGALGNLYRTLGYTPHKSTKDDGGLRLVAGHIYADPAIVAKFFDGGIPMTYDLDEVARDSESLHAAPKHFDPDACGPWFLLALPWLLLRTARAAWLAMPRVTTIQARQRHTLERFHRWYIDQRQRIAAAREPIELTRQFTEVTRYVTGPLAAETLSWGVHAAVAASRLTKCLERLQAVTGRPAGSVAELLKRVVSWPLAPDSAADLVARGRMMPDAFLQHYGHRGENEWELSATTYDRHDLDQLASINAPNKRAAAIGADDRDSDVSFEIDQHDRAWIPAPWNNERIERWLAEGCGEQRHVRTNRLLRRAVQRTVALGAGRELGRDVWLKGYHVLRLIAQRLAKLCELDCGQPADLYFLMLEEVETLSSAPRRPALKELIIERRSKWQSEYVRAMPAVIDGRSQSMQQDAIDGSDSLSDVPFGTQSFEGQALSPGTTFGRALHILDVQDGRFRNGTATSQVIVIVESLDTSLISILPHVAGVIAERGGLLSHAAVVARQLGIPMVRMPHASGAIRDGESICINGSLGTVTRNVNVPPDP